MENQYLAEVLKVLKEGGESEEDIAQVIQEITNAASAKLYLEMTSVLTEEDMKLLDKCQTQEEAEPLLRSLYTQRSDISPETLVLRFIEVFSKAFIDKYQMDKVAAMEKPVEAAASAQA